MSELTSINQGRVATDSRDTTLTPEERKAIEWRILSSMKVEVFEIYSDGVEARIGSLSIDPTGNLSISPNISGKKLIARKFKFEDISPRFHESYRNRLNSLKLGWEEEVLAYRIVHSHSVEIEEIYSRGLLGGIDLGILSGVSPTLSIGGQYERIKGRKFSCSGEIAVPEPTPPPKPAPKKIPEQPRTIELNSAFKTLLRLASVSLYVLAGLIVRAAIDVLSDSSLTGGDKVTSIVIGTMLYFLLCRVAGFLWDR